MGRFQEGPIAESHDDQVQAIISMKAKGEKVARIARTVSLSRLTIYRVLERHRQRLIEAKNAI